jgi:hypothetical protein
LLRFGPMTSTYLSMRATQATPGRALRFERGRPIAEFSVGRRGIWRASAPGVGERHVWVSFDGQCLVLRRDNGREPVVVDGRPLPLTPLRIVRLPCRVELGEARLVVDDQVPPLAVLDASAIERVAPSRAEVERATTEVGSAQAHVGAAQVVASTGEPPDVLVPARREQTLGDGFATSVMPLEVLIQRGIAAAARAREPHAVGSRTRRPHREPPRREPARRESARQRTTSAAAAWMARARRWLLELVPKSRVTPAPRRLLAVALLVPILPLLCQLLSPGYAASSTESAALEGRISTRPGEGTIAIAGTNVAPPAVPVEPAAPEGPAVPEEPRSPAAPVEPVVRPILGIEALDGSPPRNPDERKRSPGAATPRVATRTPTDAASGLTGERLAVDALATGDRARARALYVSLASRSPDNAAFAEAARILAAERNAASRSEAGSDQHEERLADGHTTRAR